MRDRDDDRWPNRWDVERFDASDRDRDRDRGRDRYRDERDRPQQGDWRGRDRNYGWDDYDRSMNRGSGRDSGYGASRFEGRGDSRYDRPFDREYAGGYEGSQGRMPGRDFSNRGSSDRYGYSDRWGSGDYRQNESMNRDRYGSGDRGHMETRYGYGTDYNRSDEDRWRFDRQNRDDERSWGRGRSDEFFDRGPRDDDDRNRGGRW